MSGADHPDDMPHAGAADESPSGHGSADDQVREAQDRLLRTQAELENFRKRSPRSTRR